MTVQAALYILGCLSSIPGHYTECQEVHPAKHLDTVQGRLCGKLPLAENHWYNIIHKHGDSPRYQGVALQKVKGLMELLVSTVFSSGLHHPLLSIIQSGSQKNNPGAQFATRICFKLHEQILASHFSLLYIVTQSWIWASTNLVFSIFLYKIYLYTLQPYTKLSHCTP